MKSTAFDLFHPVVALAYFAILLVMSMAAMQPVYLLVSLAAALALGAVLRGVRAVARSLAWQLPLVAIVALANPLFSASGSTELFRIGARAFYLESFVYGACMGVMLASVLLTFSNASRVLTSDKIMALFGGVVPTVGLMMSMTARLVPQFVRRGGDIEGVARACTAARPVATTSPDSTKGAGRRLRFREHMRLTSVLMGWSMEDSLETADAMKARGWGAAPKRTTYARFLFRRLDACALAFLMVVGASAVVAAWAACAQFRFYPFIAGFASWWSYAPYVLFAALPLVMEARERIVWMS